MKIMRCPYEFLAELSLPSTEDFDSYARAFVEQCSLFGVIPSRDASGAPEQMLTRIKKFLLRQSCNAILSKHDGSEEAVLIEAN